MWALLIVEPDIAVQRCLELFAGSEVVALPDFFDAAIKTLVHAVGLARFRWREAMRDARGGAQRFELERAVGGTFAQAKRRSVNPLPLPVRIVRMHSGQARSRPRRKRRALATVLALKTRLTGDCWGN